MGIEITRVDLPTQEEAQAALKEAGFPFFVPLDVPPVENTSHWHSFSSVFFVTEGNVQLTDVATGTTHEAGPGSRVSVPERTLHHEYSADGYKILLGVTHDPATFEEDVNLPPEALDA